MRKYLKFKTSKSNKSRRVDWNEAPDIKIRVDAIVKDLSLDWLNSSRIYCFRSDNSKSRAYARIWGTPKVWQKALKQEPAYVIEVLSEKFDKLNKNKQNKILIHEIAHIPNNFSGSLLPHIRSKGKRNFDDRVERMYKAYKSVSK